MTRFAERVPHKNPKCFPSSSGMEATTFIGQLNPTCSREYWKEAQGRYVVTHAPSQDVQYFANISLLTEQYTSIG